MQGDTVVTMPAIQCCLDFLWRNGGHNGPWRLSVVSLARSVTIESSVVHNPPWTAIKLGSNDHPAAPSDWVIDRDLLEDAQANVTVQTLLDRLLPMKGHLTGGVDCHRCGLLIGKDLEGRRVLHEAERLMLATVESTALESVQDVLFQPRKILWCRGTW